ncbi:lipopolysaccharide heptosyltransferase II [Neisseria sp. Ec49-e6-T10]|uniref:lipopolysaccharide heptosyltransferase II n=1 Tax=Neisseria sp. Ec49-e6-T10 TaxID=3140744 RepID=UPI003EC0F4FA
MAYKILIIAPSWVGDSVMAQPLYQRLHEQHKNLQLHVFAPQWTLPVLDRMEQVFKTYLNPFGHGQLQLFTRFKVAKQLKQERFDQAIVLPNSLKSALIPMFANIPLRTGYIGEARRGILNDARALNETTLPKMVERFYALAEPESVPIIRPVPYPVLSIKTEEQQRSLTQLNLQLDKPIIAFCPGAEYGPAKRWPAKYFAQLAQKFQEAGYNIWLFGSQKDKAIADEINQLSAHHCINLCGQTNLAQAIDLLALTQLVICNDSGLMHIAAALKRPLVALYGSSSPDFTPPLSEEAKILNLHLECSPCFERECPLGHLNCLNNLYPDMVWDAAQQFL